MKENIVYLKLKRILFRSLFRGLDQKCSTIFFKKWYWKANIKILFINYWRVRNAKWHIKIIETENIAIKFSAGKKLIHTYKLFTII